MFDCLKILPQPALAEVILKNLGRINVVCGKNNSGKSTLLRSIADAEKRAIGLALPHDALSQYVSKDLNLLRPEHEGYRAQLRALINHAEGLWFANEENRFARLINELWLINRELKGIQFKLEPFVQAYRTAFPVHIPTVLIPPKRQIDVLSPMDMGQSVLPDGKWVVAQLFRAKNQPSANDERVVYDLVLEAFRHITSGYEFGIFASRENQITLQFSLHGSEWVDADVCGLGLQDVLVILFFAIHPSQQLVLIEEPESHLHPDMQRKLLSFLQSGTDKQFFLTTHSNIFLDAGFVDQVFFTAFTDIITVDDVTSRAMLLSDLGYAVTDNLVSDLIILVEGPNDETVLKQYLIKMGLYDQYNIKFWPVGGDIMGRLNLEVFAQRYKIIALVDLDPGSGASRHRFVENCRALGIPVTRLQRYAMENYYTVRALREVFKGQIAEDFMEIDPNTKLEGQIKIDVKKNSRRLASAMSLEEIEGTDLAEFLNLVKSKCEET